MSTLFHVLVRPHPDEALLVSPAQIAAGRAWLDEHCPDAKAFEETGGFFLLRMPSDDRATARTQLTEWFAPYPLLNSAAPITYTAHVVVELDDGFAVLYAAQAAGVRVADMVQA